MPLYCSYKTKVVTKTFLCLSFKCLSVSVTVSITASGNAYILPGGRRFFTLNMLKKFCRVWDVAQSQKSYPAQKLNLICASKVSSKSMHRCKEGSCSTFSALDGWCGSAFHSEWSVKNSYALQNFLLYGLLLPEFNCLNSINQLGIQL